MAFIVRQCLEKNPRERFQSARDLELHFGAMSSGQVSTQTAEVAAVGPSRKWWILPAAVATAASLLVAAGAWVVVGRLRGGIVGPEYRQLTYRRGFIDAARFTGDGHTIVFSASWDGAPPQAFSMRLESPESRPLDLKPASLLAVSSSGEVAVSLNGQRLSRLLAIGTLARVPIMGGSPREIMKDVVQADWSPDGAVLAVIRRTDGKYRLEYPVGKVLYENSGGLADVRISRDGRTVAFTEHPALPDDRGDICVVGPDGVKRVVSAGWASVSGLAWSPRGDEIWFTASEIGANTSLWAMKPGGTRRLMIRSLGRKTVLDVAPDGQALLSEGRLRFMMAYRDAPQAADRMLSWLDASFAADMSSDGATLIFDEQGEGSRSHGYSTYLRKSDGSAAIRLGDGYAGSLSPDTQRVAALTVGSPTSVTILPTGAGESASLARGPIVAYNAVGWTPDSQSVVFAGHEQGHGARVYLQNIKDGTPRPVSPEGYTFPPYTAPVSPDGRTIIAVGAAGQLAKISLSDGTVHPLEGSQPGDMAMRWTADGRAVFVARRHDRPASIWRVAAERGHRDFVLTLAPTDQAGYTAVLTAQITPDGRHLAYSFGQNLMDLYLVRGLQ
jgi:Tol biopolymer transport system component